MFAFVLHIFFLEISTSRHHLAEIKSSILFSSGYFHQEELSIKSELAYFYVEVYGKTFLCLAYLSTIAKILYRDHNGRQG